MTSIDGGASGNFSSSGPEPFAIEDIDAFGSAASIASKSKFAAKEEEIEKFNWHKLKGVTVETALTVIPHPPRLHRLSLSDTRETRKPVELKSRGASRLWCVALLGNNHC